MRLLPLVAAMPIALALVNRAAVPPAVPPVSVVFLYDFSLSVTNDEVDQDEQFRLAANALAKLADANDRLRMGYIARRSEISPLLSFAEWQKLGKLTPRVADEDRFGPSPVWDAVDDAVSALEHETGRRAVLVVSDGGATGNRHSRDEVAAHARAAGVTVAAIAEDSLMKRPGTTLPVNPAAGLAALARATGGPYEFDDGWNPNGKLDALVAHVWRQLKGQAAPMATVYVTAVGQKNAPVRGLKAADFVVKENGQERPIHSVEPASAPLHVALCGDWFGDVGDEKPLEPFAAAVFARQPATVVALDERLQWTHDLRRLHTAITSPMMHDARTQSNALTCILAASRVLAGAELSRPVVVAFFNEQLEEHDGTEMGQSLEINSLTEGAIVDAFRGGPTSLWALVRPANGALQPNSTNDALRRRVYTDATSRTGGLWLDAGLDSKSATKALLTIADLLDAQYAVTYAPAGAGGTGDLKVTTSRKDVRLLAPEKH